nr:hypothetical protein [Tanacetum cinerariifolium]
TVTTAPSDVTAAVEEDIQAHVIPSPAPPTSPSPPQDIPSTSYDKGKGILVEEPKPMKKKQQVEMDEAYARKMHEELN